MEEKKIEKHNEISNIAWKQLWDQFPREKSLLPKIQDNIRYKFKNIHLLYEALTHRSALNPPLRVCSFSDKPAEDRQFSLPWNERIEFLGDAVLNLVVSSFLWNRQEKLSEGDLSRLRSSIVRESSLSDLAKKFGIGGGILLGKGESKSGGREREALLADTLEAIIGAVYLDGGFAQATEFIHYLFEEYLYTATTTNVTDYKTALQELVQNKFKVTPTYKAVGESGPDHAKEFVVAVYVKERMCATGKGDSKKKASQKAAQLALSLIKDESSQSQ